VHAAKRRYTRTPVIVTPRAQIGYNEFAKRHRCDPLRTISFGQALGYNGADSVETDDRRTRLT